MGFLFQSGIAFGSTYHVKTLPVLFAGNRLRTINHPFCPRFRPSKSMISVSGDFILINFSGSSGARHKILPVVSGAGIINSPLPLSSKVVWFANCFIFLSEVSILVLLDGYKGN